MSISIQRARKALTVTGLRTQTELKGVRCFDVETDRFNTVVGYEGRAYARIQLLEEIEKTGDVLTWQDLTTGESQQAVIEQVTFTRMTPPDKRFDGFGGVIEITVRTV